MDEIKLYFKFTNGKYEPSETYSEDGIVLVSEGNKCSFGNGRYLFRWENGHSISEEGWNWSFEVIYEHTWDFYRCYTHISLEPRKNYGFENLICINYTNGLFRCPSDLESIHNRIAGVLSKSKELMIKCKTEREVYQYMIDHDWV